jgi:hypothetical protein
MTDWVRFQASYETDQATGCWVWKKKPRNDGYGRLKVDGKMVTASRYSASKYLGFDLRSTLQVLHQCDNRMCVNPEHLFIGTAKDNMQDKVRKGRGNHFCGESGNTNVLKQDQIPEILRLYANGHSSLKIGKVFGVCQQTVMNIINGKSWKHIPRPERQEC